MAGIVQGDPNIAAYNAAIVRRALDEFEIVGYTHPIDADRIERIGRMSYVTIKGITDFWKNDESDEAGRYLYQLINGLAANNMIFAFILSGDANGIRIRLGVSDFADTSLLDGLQALYKGSEIEPADVTDLQYFADGFGGAVVGAPSVTKEDETAVDRIATLAKTMIGTEFVYIVLARGVSPIQTNMAHDHILQEMQRANSLIRKTVTGGHMGNESLQFIDFAAQEYAANLKLIEKLLQEGCNTGLWRTSIYYAAKERDAYQKLSNAIKMVFGGPNSKPDRLRCIRIPGIGRYIAQTCMLGDLSPDYRSHPLGAWMTENAGVVNMYIYMFQTIMSASHLATVVGLPSTEMPGFYVDAYVEFDTAPRKDPPPENALVLGQIMSAGRKDAAQFDNPYCFDVMDLNRHGLIIGITGGGKTNTTKYILQDLWNRHHKPFLVIESAKREYWELMNMQGFEGMMLFTLGSEEPGKAIRYRINPFEVVGSVSLQTHIDYLLSTFKAAFELYPPMPYVLETSVYEVYRDRGWDIVTNRNVFGFTDYPTLTDLYRKIDIVTDGLGYHNETKENTKAALKARINSLRIGGKGAMMDTRHSVPIEKLLSAPAVLELEDLGDDDTKAFVIGMLLVQLYEYRRSAHQGGQSKLVHLTMIEEAHRLLKRVPEGGENSNPRAKSVEFFCNLLAEIRSFGQGFLIADQIPTKLASDTLKNTNLKIVHRTVMEEDRQAIGRAMNMNDEQIAYLSSLRRGYAAVYAEGDNRPKMVRFPLVRGNNARSRQEVLNIIRATVESSIGDYATVHDHHMGCTYCEEQCVWKEKVLSLGTFHDARRMQALCKWVKQYNYDLPHLAGAITAAAKPEKASSYFERLCILGYFLEKTELKESDKAKAMSKYVREWRR